MINLLPYKEKKSVEKIRFLRMFQAAIGATFIIISISFVLIAPTWITVSSRHGIAKGQVDSLEQDGKITSGVDLASLQNQTITVREKLNSPIKNSPTEFVTIIRSLTPLGVVIDRFSTTNDPKIMEVSGISKNRELLQSFIGSLGLHEGVSKVDNPVSNFIKNKNGTFKLTVTFK